MINVNNDSINGVAQGFSSSNEIMSYRGSNPRTGITTEERNKQSVTKKLQNNIETKDNANKNHTVDNNKVKEKNKKIIILGDSMSRYQRPKFLSKNNNLVNIRFHPGTTTEDIVDFVKPVIRKKPDAITDFPTNFGITNSSLKTLRLNNPKNVIFSYLNINSIRNKIVVARSSYEKCWHSSYS